MTTTPRQRLPRSDEGAFTLVEVLVTLILTALVLALITPLLATVEGSFNVSTQLVAAEGQARLAIMNLTRQVASAAEVCAPTQFTSTGFALRALSIVSTTNTGGTLTTTYRWEQWMVSTSSHSLEEEVSATMTSPSGTVTWPSASGSPVWVVVAKHVVNSTTAPFAMGTVVQGSPQGWSVELQVSSGGKTPQIVPISSQVVELDSPYLTSPPACSTLTPAQ